MMQVTPSSPHQLGLGAAVVAAAVADDHVGRIGRLAHDGELTLDPFALVEDRDHDGILVGPGPELLDGRGGELPIGGGLERVEIIHKARVPRERAAARTSRGTDGRPMWTGHRSRRPGGAPARRTARAGAGSSLIGRVPGGDRGMVDDVAAVRLHPEHEALRLVADVVGRGLARFLEDDAEVFRLDDQDDEDQEEQPVDLERKGRPALGDPPPDEVGHADVDAVQQVQAAGQ